MSDDEDKNPFDPVASANQGSSVITSMPRITPNRMVRTMPVESDRDKEYLTLKVVRPSNQLNKLKFIQAFPMCSVQNWLEH